MAEGTDAPQVQYEVKVTPKLVWVILAPYLYARIMEQVQAVLPISAFLFLFQLIVLRQGIANAISITVGLVIVILGLMFFMDGLRLGLMPLGENIGSTLPAKAAMWLVLAFAFVIGIIATFAEPAIGTLKAAGSNIRPADAPLLFEMLNASSLILVFAVGTGVGIATVFGVYRFVRGWSLKVLLFPTLAITLIVTVIAQLNPDTAAVVSLAWDTGAITTGPVTVPLVLSLGLGVSAVLGQSDTGMSGFGIVTLASLWPITMVLLASMAIYYMGGVGDIAAAEATAAATQSAPPAGFVDLLRAAVLAALQAIVPLVLVLYLVQRFILREEVRNVNQIILGIAFCLIGLWLFNFGLSTGLVALGDQVGKNVPSAFAEPVALYGEVGGRIVVIIFAFLLGYGATLAEPALNALGLTVEEVTAGAFKKVLLMHAVALGVSLGLAAGIAKIMFNWPIAYIVIPSYLLLVVITLLSEEKYINIGWDSAGVTTGPITVPLVLAMGLGVGVQVGVPEGFGMLTLASIGPIMTVLVMGLIVSKTQGRAPQPAASVSQAGS
jgi:hypothetical protein